jgi:Muramidase (flagellum-specific)
MKINLKTKLLIFALTYSISIFPQPRNQAYLSYIDQYGQLAVRQQKEYGIPASITLAQGLLESGAGVSSFAKESNNHFGIKCTDWAGEKIYHDDDAQGECFRKYTQVIESYEDHSLFLKNRKRYSFLFELKPTDYEGWAFGLKKAGYATDPAYAYKLISIIEDYDLHSFDLGKRGDYASVNVSKYERNSGVNAGTTRQNSGTMGAITALVNHELRKVNGVKFITALPGDNYAVIADEFNLSVQRLLCYNDLTAENRLIAGTRIFVDSKKNKAPRECKTHEVLDGESMYSISQDYGVKVVKLYKINNMSFSQGVSVGQVLKLR